MKRMVKGLLAGVLMFSLAGCGSSDNETKSATKVVIGTQEMPNDEGIAKALKYFEDELAIDVEYKNFDSGRDVATALMTGDIDFGLLGSCPAALSIAQGAEVEYIWTHEVLGSVESLVVKEGIGSASDLAGKTIATPFASTAHYSLLKYLESNRIDAKSVNILDMQPAEIYSSWQSNQIDGAYIWQPTLAQLNGANVLTTSGDMAKAGYMTANVELVTKSFAKANPKLVEKYIKALDKAVRLYQDDQSQAIKTISKAMDLDEAATKFQMSGSTWLNASEQIASEYMGTSEAKGAIADNLYDIANFLKDQGSIMTVPKKAVFSDAINSSYCESVK